MPVVYRFNDIVYRQNRLNMGQRGSIIFVYHSPIFCFENEKANLCSAKVNDSKAIKPNLQFIFLKCIAIPPPAANRRDNTSLLVTVLFCFCKWLGSVCTSVASEYIS